MTDRNTTTRALWYAGAGLIEIRNDVLKAPGLDDIVVETHFSSISRGTERLVLAGAVPDSEYDRMRAPFQDGAFPFPVKYGYSACGRVLDGRPEMLGKFVFVLHPHQERFVVPAHVAVPIPDSVPVRRAILAANMETALNALWDSGAGPGDRIIVVGGGVVGLLTAYLAAELPGTDVVVIDPEPARRPIAHALGAGFAPDLPSAGLGEARADVAFHTSATSAGLATAIASLGFEGAIVEMSWYGDARTPVALGAQFHSQRLKLISSQVGQVSAARRPRWSHRRRLEKALDLLQAPVLDQLIGEEIAFAETPRLLPNALGPGASGLAPIIRYEASRSGST